MDIMIRFLNGFLMIGMPLALGAFLVWRLRKPWNLFGIGVLTFLGSQVFHIPFNIYVLAPLMDALPSALISPTAQDLFIGLTLGLSAGVFEEVARYVAYRGWIKADREWSGALVFGAGHGGIEAIIFGGLTLYALIQAISLRNGDLSTLVPAEQIHIIESQLSAYWKAPWYVAILGAVERVFALSLHLCASVMVLQVFKRDNRLWLAAAIGWHALANASAYVVLIYWGVFASEGIVGIFAVISILIILKLRPQDTQDLPPSTTHPYRSLPQSTSADISQEKIEDSRYA